MTSMLFFANDTVRAVAGKARVIGIVRRENADAMRPNAETTPPTPATSLAIAFHPTPTSFLSKSKSIIFFTKPMAPSAISSDAPNAAEPTAI